MKRQKLYTDVDRVSIILKVQRLQHHASIAVWAGNNENEAALVQNWFGTNDNYEQYKMDYIKLYVDTIMPVVHELDTTRTFLVISSHYTCRCYLNLSYIDFYVLHLHFHVIKFDINDRHLALPMGFLKQRNLDGLMLIHNHGFGAMYIITIMHQTAGILQRIQMGHDLFLNSVRMTI